MAEYYREHGNSERYEIGKRNTMTALAAIDHFKNRLPHDLKIKIDAGRADWLKSPLRCSVHPLDRISN